MSTRCSTWPPTSASAVCRADGAWRCSPPRAAPAPGSRTPAPRAGSSSPKPDADLQGTIRSFIPAYGSTLNPVDITAQAVFGGGFERALGLLVRSPDFDAVAGVGSMVREDRFLSSLDELREAVDGATSAVVFYAYTRPGRAVVSALSELGIPCYSSPARAARALAAALGYRAFLDAHALEEARL